MGLLNWLTGKNDKVEVLQDRMYLITASEMRGQAGMLGRGWACEHESRLVTAVRPTG
jgi:hypothetical protein